MVPIGETVIETLRGYSLCVLEHLANRDLLPCENFRRSIGFTEAVQG